MHAFAHHLPALYALVGSVAVPVLFFAGWRWLHRRRERLAREAMARGNRLYRNWLDQSKGAEEQV